MSMNDRQWPVPNPRSGFGDAPWRPQPGASNADAQQSLRALTAVASPSMPSGDDCAASPGGEKKSPRPANKRWEFFTLIGMSDRGVLAVTPTSS